METSSNPRPFDALMGNHTSATTTEDPFSPIDIGKAAIMAIQDIFRLAWAAIAARWQEDQKAFTMFYFGVAFSVRMFLRTPYAGCMPWTLTMIVEDLISLASFVIVELHLHRTQGPGFALLAKRLTATMSSASARLSVAPRTPTPTGHASVAGDRAASAAPVRRQAEDIMLYLLSM